MLAPRRVSRSAFLAIASCSALACSSVHEIGNGGRSEAGETCSKSSDCVDDLRCIDSRCGGGNARTVGAPAPPPDDESVKTSAEGGAGPSSYSACTSDEVCAARSAYSPYCRDNVNCVECIEDDHCEASSSGKHCKLPPDAKELSFCVACLEDVHCTDPKEPRCATGKYHNYCRECLVHADCKDPEKRYCEVTKSGDSAPSGYCRECLVNAHCTEPSAPICRSGYCTK